MSLTMTRHELNKLVACYIIAVGPSGSPSSHVWMAVDPNMDDIYKHQTLVGALVSADLINMSNHFITLTPKGLSMHEKLVQMTLPDIAKPTQKEGSS